MLPVLEAWARGRSGQRESPRAGGAPSTPWGGCWSSELVLPVQAPHRLFLSPGDAQAAGWLYSSLSPAPLARELLVQLPSPLAEGKLCCCELPGVWGLGSLL